MTKIRRERGGGGCPLIGLKLMAPKRIFCIHLFVNLTRLFFYYFLKVDTNLTNFDPFEVVFQSIDLKSPFFRYKIQDS